jgi:hypothetical protein
VATRLLVIRTLAIVFSLGFFTNLAGTHVNGGKIKLREGSWM